MILNRKSAEQALEETHLQLLESGAMSSNTLRIFLRLCVVCFVIHGFQFGPCQARINSSCALSYGNDWIEKKAGTSRVVL